MKKIGVYISGQKPKGLNEEMMGNATTTKIINMGCMDKDFCLALSVPKVVDLGIEDPKGRPIWTVRETKDEFGKSTIMVFSIDDDT
jgi:hypothetical protein